MFPKLSDGTTNVLYVVYAGQRHISQGLPTWTIVYLGLMMVGKPYKQEIRANLEMEVEGGVAYPCLMQCVIMKPRLMVSGSKNENIQTGPCEG